MFIVLTTRQNHFIVNIFLCTFKRSSFCRQHRNGSCELLYNSWQNATHVNGRWLVIIRSHRTREMRTNAIDDSGRCLSVCLSVCHLSRGQAVQKRLNGSTFWGPWKQCVRQASPSSTAKGGGSMWHSPNYCGQLLLDTAAGLHLAASMTHVVDASVTAVTSATVKSVTETYYRL